MFLSLKSLVLVHSSRGTHKSSTDSSPFHAPLSSNETEIRAVVVLVQAFAKIRVTWNANNLVDANNLLSIFH